MTERPDIEAIIAEIDRKAKERAERIPDTQAALRLMFDCCERLKELGWRDIVGWPLRVFVVSSEASATEA